MLSGNQLRSLTYRLFMTRAPSYLGGHRAPHRLRHRCACVSFKSKLPLDHIHDTLLSAPTRIIALENTLNGTIMPQKDVLEISKNAHTRDIIMHLDGARIWHVAAETGLSMKELCDPFDSVSLCLSKGLGKICAQTLLRY
jgi:threonine aldolase